MTLKHTLAAIPAGNTRRTYGTAYWDGSEWFANISGNVVAARWLDPIQPLQGGKIVVDITDDGNGQATALVIGGYTDQPRPSTGTVADVLPAGPAVQIVFTGEDAVSYTTDRFIGSYNIGDPVYITWDAATPTIIGKIQTIAPPPPADVPTPPSTAPTSDTKKTAATASDTWGVGGWGRWATSQGGGEDIYTGTWGGYTLSGAWFYGPGNTVLAGKTITAARFRLPQRLNVGANGSATVNLYAHTNQSRPGSDVNRVAGPHTITVGDDAPPGWVLLPASFHAVLVAGGGISIAGGTYAGFMSRLKDPDSGKLELDWNS